MKERVSGHSLTYSDTRFVKGMLLRGDRQHDIAAYFGVNGGRVAEIASGDNKYPSAKPMGEGKLPPAGPYLTKYALDSVVDALSEAVEAIELAEAEEDVADIKAALNLAKETNQNKIDGLGEIYS